MIRQIINNILTTVIALCAFSTYISANPFNLRQDRPAKTGIVQTKDDSKIVDAVQKYEDGDYQGAINILNTILKSEPDNDAAWYYKGMCSIRMKDASGAESDLKKAVSLDSSNYWYRYMLAAIYGLTGRSILTIDMYESLLKDFPKRSELYYNLANLYINQGQAAKALKTIDDIETQFGKSDGTVMTKFDILRQQGKNEEAYNILKEYTKEYSSAQALAMLGDYEMGTYNDSSALSYYNQALLIDKDYGPAILGKVEAYRMTRKYPQYFSTLDSFIENRNIPAQAKGDYLGAIVKQLDPRFINTFTPMFDSTMNLAISLHPADSSIMEPVGIYYYLTDRKDKAAGIFKSVMKEYPESVEATANYIQMLVYNKDWEKVVHESDSAFARFPKEYGFLELANVGEFNLQNWKGIIHNCEEMLRSAPGDSAVCVTAWSTIGDIYHQIGDKVKAYKAYDNALKAAPDYAPVLNNYAYYLSMEGKKLKKAYAMSKKTIEQEPDNATYLDTFGWILYLQGKALEAKPFFKHAMLYGGKDSATILDHYATVLDALGETELAKVYRQQAKNKAAEGLE